MYAFPSILKDRVVVKSLGKTPQYAVSVETVLKDEPQESLVKTVCALFILPVASLQNFFLWEHTPANTQTL